MVKPTEDQPETTLKEHEATISAEETQGRGKKRPRSTPGPADRGYEGARVVDLQPEAVSDLTPPDPATPEPATPGLDTIDQPPPPQGAKRNSLAGTALVGLIAGIIGSIGMYAASNQLQPRLPPSDPAISTRLAASEAAQAASAKREAVLSAEMEALKRALAGESEARKAALLEKAPPVSGSASGEAGVSKAEIAELSAQITALGDARARSDALAARIDSLAAATARHAGQNDFLRHALALSAIDYLGEAFRNGDPLLPPLDVLKNLGVAEADLAAFVPFADKGAPGIAQLQQEFQAALKAPPKPVAPPEAKTSAPSFFDALKAKAGALIEIRNSRDGSGQSSAAIVKDTNEALTRGNLPAALAHLARLAPEQGAPLAIWRMRADARLKAEAALMSIKRNALGALAKAGPIAQPK